MNTKQWIRPAMATFGALTLSALPLACGGNETHGTNAGTEFPEEQAREAADTYAEIVRASYADSLELAKELAAANKTLVDEPTEDNLTAARQAWLDSREPYLQTEVYRFYEGPIDNEEDGPEGLINAWPLDEAYIDYVEGMPEAGLINDTDEEISAENLVSLNEQGGEANIATGYHAIEFLLWGQDMNDNSPGERPASDYDTADNADRRGEYLITVSDLLVTHLQQLIDAWDPSADASYGAKWEDLSGEEALRRALTGMIILSGFETGGERLQTALDSGDQEDEHSCFSDNTHRDMIQDIQGVLNVWTGSYTALDGTKIEGTGIRAAVEEVDAELAEALDTQMAESLSLANHLETPFDQEIASDNSKGRERVRALVQSLREQENLLEDVFREFDLNVPVAE